MSKDQIEGKNNNTNNDDNNDESLYKIKNSTIDY